jgi:hypothetical protein
MASLSGAHCILPFSGAHLRRFAKVVGCRWTMQIPKSAVFEPPALPHPPPLLPHGAPTSPLCCRCLARWKRVSGHLERPDFARSRQTRRCPPPPPASQPDHLRWCWLVFCDAPSPPDQNDHSAACVCRFLRVRNLGLWRGGGGSTLGVCEGS